MPSGGPGADSASASAGGSSPPFEKHLQDGIEHLGIEIDGGVQQGGFSWGSSSSWATRGGDDNRPWIELNFGRMAEIGSMSYAQRTNVGGECFQDVQLAFDGGATANLVLQ